MENNTKKLNLKSHKKLFFQVSYNLGSLNCIGFRTFKYFKFIGFLKFKKKVTFNSKKKTTFKQIII